MPLLSKRLFARAVGAAAVLAALAQAPAAQAQGGSFYGLLEGGYLWDFGSYQHGPDTGIYPHNQLTARPDAGWSGRFGGGYNLNQRWDIGLSFGGTVLGRDQRQQTIICCADLGTTTGVSKQNARLFTTDLEGGMRIGGGGVSGRLSGGLRLAIANHKLEGAFDSTGVPDAQENGTYRNRTHYLGVGPRIGAQFWVPFGNSGFGFTSQLAASLLYGPLSERNHLVDTVIIARLGPVTTITDEHKSAWRLAGTVDGDLGFYFAMGGRTPIALTLGWRFQSLLGGADKSFEASRSAGDRLMHGPYARFTINFGPRGSVGGDDVADDGEDDEPPPPRARAAAAPAGGQGPAAPQGRVAAAPAPTADQVPFQGDTFLIGGNGFALIQQAAVQSRRQPQRLTVSGARAGGYDASLARQRANAVQSTLVMNGVPADAVAIAEPGASVSGARVVIYIN